MRRRCGFTVLELVVVLGILSLVAALVLAGVQKARHAALRAACGNNLRQLGLALHSYHGVRQQLPPGIRPDKDPFPFMTWLARSLPHLEQPAAWGEAVEDYRRQPDFGGPTPHRNLARPLPAFLCPADGRRVGTTDEGATAAFTFYLGVTGAYIAEWNGLLYRDSAVRWADVRDGTSQTLMIGERPPSPDNHFGWWYAGIGQDRGLWDGSADALLAVRDANRTFRAPTCPRGHQPFKPGNPDDMCDTFHFWSRHDGGAHFAFADGSVRFVRYSANDVLPALATRAGGEAATLPD